MKWSQDNFFNKWYRENWTTFCKKKKKKRNYSNFTPHTKVNSEWIKDLYTTPESINTVRKIQTEWSRFGPQRQTFSMIWFQWQRQQNGQRLTYGMHQVKRVSAWQKKDGIKWKTSNFWGNVSHEKGIPKSHLTLENGKKNREANILRKEGVDKK